MSPVADEQQGWTRDALAQLDQQVADAQARAADAARLADDVTTVVGRSRSPRGDVKVTTDASGRVTDIQLSDDAVRYRASDLAQILMRTITQARRDAAGQVMTMAADTFGRDSATYARLAAELGGADETGAAR